LVSPQQTFKELFF